MEMHAIRRGKYSDRIRIASEIAVIRILSPYLLILRKPNSSHSDRGGTDRGGTAEGQTERYSCFDDPIGSVNVLSVPPALGSVSKFRRRPRLTTISWL
jgi:hypothetical protein